MLIVAIVACEVLFWVFLLGGLAVRYLLGLRRLATLVLLGSPVADLVLLALSIIDLRAGGQAEVAHGLAAAYVGYSVGCGHRILSWVDQWFAHRLAGGPPPVPKPRYGRERGIYELRAWLVHLRGYLLTMALLGGAVVMVGDPERTVALRQLAVLATVLVVIDGVVSLTYLLAPPTRSPTKKEPTP